MLNFPRETVEYLPLTATLDDAPTTTFEVSVVPRGQRPTTWTPAPYLIDGLTPGTYEAFTRVTDNPERPVTSAGLFTIT